ncbi:MAG: tetratricopeptide repeat-containing sensor histidine kinase [Microscillaceae bacterium]|nr:tetratricopeptide repeat-containing sensor histidine kinase [Microscillaceae bacterium]
MYIDEAKTDSLLFLANQIKDLSTKINYVEGLLQYGRFIGWYYEFEGMHDKAVDAYFVLQKDAEKYNQEKFKYMAMNGIATCYIQTNQLEKAKNVLKSAISQQIIAKSNPLRISTFYNNLGIVYKRQNKNDSAFLMYDKSLQIKIEAKDSLAIANQKINMTALLVRLKRYDEAEKFINENLSFLKNKNRDADVWSNLNNLSGLKFAQGKYIESEKIIEKLLLLAKKLDSNQKLFESYNDLAEVQVKLEKYKSAIENFKKAAEYKEKIINLETNEKISELQEKYNADEREKENKLLSSQLENEKIKQWFTIIASVLFALLAIVIGFALRKNRKKNAQLANQNELITQQKDKLTELNIEKNNLISIVSHDLRSPFNAIGLWNKTLQENLNKSPMKVAEATEMIEKTVVYGQNLINNILDIEKIDINSHQVELQKTNLSELLKELIADFEPAANGKQIKINFEESSPNLSLLTDPILLRRAIENLISNALKFSHRESVVNVFLEEKSSDILIKVQDFGVGIAENEQPNLFSKYGKTSTQPTAGEATTGLGLSIVKRIADELGGKISFTTESGKGSEFVFSLKK